MGGLNKRPPNAAGTILGRKKKPEDIEFEKERERHVQRAEDEAKKLREWVEIISKSLLDDASKTFKALPANDPCAFVLRKSCEWLNVSIRDLDAILRFTPSAVRRAEILYVATELLRSAHLIARYSPTDETTKTIKTLDARRANRGNVAEAHLRHKHLRTAILDVTKGVPLVGSETFAESIRDGVLQHESLKEIIEKNQGTKRAGWPSTRTIRREIEAILIECRNT